MFYLGDFGLFIKAIFEYIVIDLVSSLLYLLFKHMSIEGFQDLMRCCQIQKLYSSFEVWCKMAGGMLHPLNSAAILFKRGLVVLPRTWLFRKYWPRNLPLNQQAAFKVCVWANKVPLRKRHRDSQRKGKSAKALITDQCAHACMSHTVLQVRVPETKPRRLAVLLAGQDASRFRIWEKEAGKT